MNNNQPRDHAAWFDLMGLPMELVLRVVELVQHTEDLVNLYSSSKVIRDIAKHVWGRHLENKNKYHNVIVVDTKYGDYSGWAVGNEMLHPVFALRDLVRDKEIMSDYCRVLKLRGLAEDGTLEDSHQYYGLLYLVLPMLLKRVQVLELIVVGEGLADPSIRRTWELLLESNDTSQPVMGQIQELRIIGDDCYFQEILERFPFYLQLPQLRRIYGHLHLDDMKLWNFEVCWDTLEELHLDGSNISSSAMTDLLRNTRCLRTFYYESGRAGRKEHEVCGHWPGDFEPSEYISALRRYALQTLESLTLRDNPDILGEGWRYYEDTLDSLDHDTLNEFKILKRGFEREDRVTRLVDVLTPALERFVMRIIEDNMADPNDLVPIFRDLSRMKNERLSNLRSIILKIALDGAFSDPICQTIKAECQQAGIDFQVERDPRTMHCGKDCGPPFSYDLCWCKKEAMDVDIRYDRGINVGDIRHWISSGLYRQNELQ
ncbi:MAG: hypothetical protein Q9226_003904 [Calogaya cf. arnoldii]